MPDPTKPIDVEALVEDIAQALWRIETNYVRETSGHGSRFEGKTIHAAQAEFVVREIRHAIGLTEGGEWLIEHTHSHTFGTGTTGPQPCQWPCGLYSGEHVARNVWRSAPIEMPKGSS